MLAVTREELHFILCSFVGSKKAIVFIVSGAVHRSVQNLIQSEHNSCAGVFQNLLCMRAGMDITAENMICIVQYCSRRVGKDDFTLGAGIMDQLFIVIHIIYTCETVNFIAKQFPVLFQRENILKRVNSRFFHLIQRDQMVAHLIGRVRKHQDNFFCSFSNSTEADSKPVPAEDRENNAYRLPSEFCFYICSNVINRGVISLGTGHNRFCHRNDISVANTETPFFICRRS